MLMSMVAIIMYIYCIMISRVNPLLLTLDDIYTILFNKLCVHATEFVLKDFSTSFTMER